MPNGVGFILGSIQLSLYMMYKNKSSSEESEEEDGKKEDEGSAHLVKSGIQMQESEGKEEEMSRMKNRSTLYKGHSLPKPSINRQYSQNVQKTRSLTPQELEKLTEDKDLEKGLNVGR